MMANDLKTTLTDRMAGFESFYIALDESIDLSDTAQLAIFIRGVDKEFTVTEELLALQLLQERTSLMKFKRYVRMYDTKKVKIIIIKEDRTQDKRKHTYAKLYNNMAHCQLEARCWEEAAWLAARALALQPRDAKALYRRGAARAALGLHEDAWADLQAALRERPDYTAARRARDALEPTIRRINRDYTSLVKKMFS
ncbi:General transcription factor II-I repeat domain-containing protein 2B [Eumeta japonica]|uniref:General transcription factor II-I repeat domain-containing protein 2B n=1 Tax=Eumeta variegata TaxID=151549 RepID=A0A4C1WH40_EUMVA|nr:General transcription factor II-I repeat domain-containing protein 2B [Eumeta japonica]